MRKGPEREMVGDDLNYLQGLTSLTTDESELPPIPSPMAWQSSQFTLSTFQFPTPAGYKDGDRLGFLIPGHSLS